MAKIIGLEKLPDGCKLQLELTEDEAENINLNDPIVIFSKSALELKSTTHKVSNQEGSQSIYALIPAALKKPPHNLPIKEKTEFTCGHVETVEGGYIILHWKR